jgi:hypothetical protein
MKKSGLFWYLTGSGESSIFYEKTFPSDRFFTLDESRLFVKFITRADVSFLIPFHPKGQKESLDAESGSTHEEKGSIPEDRPERAR